jgi:hypothetical protein
MRGADRTGLERHLMEGSELRGLHAFLTRAAKEQPRLTRAILDRQEILPETRDSDHSPCLPGEFAERLVRMRSFRRELDDHYSEVGENRKVIRETASLLESIVGDNPNGTVSCVGCEPSTTRRILSLLARLVPVALWIAAWLLVGQRFDARREVQRAATASPAPTPAPHPGSL